MSGFIGGVFAMDSNLFTTSTGENNDIPLSSSLFYVVTTNNLDSITGIVPNINDGWLIFVVNTTAGNNLIIKNNSASSLTNNRILTADGLDYILPPFNTAILGYDTTGQQWHVLRVPDVGLATYRATPSNPTGTISSTGVMMGLSGAFVPTKSGKLDIFISGNISNNTAADGATVQIRYGTGTSPTNGATLTGTTAGQPSGITNPSLITILGVILTPGSGNFTCSDIISGLTLGTTYWFDVSLARVTGGTASISNVFIKIAEL